MGYKFYLLLLLVCEGSRVTGCLTDDLGTLSGKFAEIVPLINTLVPTVYTDPCTTGIIETVPDPENRCPDCTYSPGTDDCFDNNDLYDLEDDVWYKSNTPMTTVCVIPFSCGTKFPIWLNGSLPTISDGVLPMKSCMSTFSTCCDETYELYVKTCTDFFAFCLVDLPSTTCPQRYCFDNDTLSAGATSITASSAITAVKQEMTSSLHRETSTLSGELSMTTVKPSTQFATASITSQPTTIPKDSCQAKPTDIVFILDASQSQGIDNFNKQLDFVLSFLQHFDIGPDQMQASVITYSFDAKIEFYLNTHFDNASLYAAIEAITYNAGATYTGSALKAARESIFLNSTSGRRNSAEKYVILLTDGLASDRTQAFAHSTRLRDDGVNILTIGTGSQVSQSELLEISGEHTNVFTVRNSDALNSVMYDLAVAVTSCGACKRKVSDVLFMVDTSTDVTEEELNGNLDSVTYLLSSLDIGINGTRIGIVTYTADVTVVLQFDSTFNKYDMYKYVQAIARQHTVESHTTKALTYARQHLFTTTYGHRESSRKIVILLSSGRVMETKEAIHESQQFQKEGIFLAVVAYGKDINGNALLNLVSDPFLFYNPGNVHGIQPNKLLPAIKTFAEFIDCGA